MLVKQQKTCMFEVKVKRVYEGFCDLGVQAFESAYATDRAGGRFVSLRVNFGIQSVSSSA